MAWHVWRRWGENLTEKGMSIIEILAGIELMWDSLSSAWFASPHPSPCFLNVLYCNPLNLTLCSKCTEKGHSSLTGLLLLLFWSEMSDVVYFAW